MKAIIGSSEGILLSKKEVDDKLKRYIPELKGTRIYLIIFSTYYIKICCYNNPSIAPIVKEGYSVETSGTKKSKTKKSKSGNVLIKYSNFLSLLGIDEDIKNAHIKIQSNKDKHTFINPENCFLDMTPDKHLFYFMELGLSKEVRIFPLEAI